MSPTQSIVLATGNAGKVREFAQLLADYPLEVLPQSQFDVQEAVEDGTTFIENAIIKARNAARATGLPAIADDSGIEVDALNGRPGIYSARFAGEGASATDNWQKLLTEMSGQSQRSARFQCVLVYMRHAEDPSPVVAQASWEGSIADAPRGEEGHGYDPIFLVNNDHRTAAELSADEKNALSHRGKAMAELLTQLKAKGIL
ncbi:RdgB/HAM1 family non-canonical purine NTP pyrophosphatase [Ferrimonas balearica]|uniref:RdgB/HAM1 family non-canonical purine NTP pyrophosphatase n=1 Tax=Ferrimonas balearica TaxID=44012 RepID=UPI001C9A1C26|nr:RdgB/HAM1 family non-canonical purine NTP pyrophosphatase [Ferrimonas balearica]MBY5921801.1 RdgB/HAM1 family non-canonical purine NTP pyrophosphatase [Ferrimonas balearica]MBY5994859.1 RdgB/HAM1 family non-canonical purine NTP pyrophosphatase [Ferrimonas balearica]